MWRPDAPSWLRAASTTFERSISTLPSGETNGLGFPSSAARSACCAWVLAVIQSVWNSLV